MLDKFKEIYFKTYDICQFGEFSNEEFCKTWNFLVLDLVDKKDIKEYCIIGLIAKYSNMNYDQVIQELKKWKKEINHD